MVGRPGGCDLALPALERKPPDRLHDVGPLLRCAPQAPPAASLSTKFKGDRAQLLRRPLHSGRPGPGQNRVQRDLALVAKPQPHSRRVRRSELGPARSRPAGVPPVRRIPVVFF